ncbi:hypothetical protein CBW65_13110 [Tumebacillus avium]|uniref:Knr4/Smi1-like domain-containing protein n=2 Tax=Tumebacillus avium TaxID=1903704 RepID=A0A1Y0IR95_9BACL|nr:hypothetical protein CBW65_13110 [Tumebacillus avium]
MLAIEALKKRLQTSPEIVVQLESGHLENVTFRFQEPASRKELHAFSEHKGWVLPPDYKAFLERHNGAMLFTHPRNGGGMELLSTERIFLANNAYDVLPDFAYPVGYANFQF